MPEAPEPATVDDRPVYTPPRATRLGARPTAAGTCSDGSGDTQVCGTSGNSATNASCQANGNTATETCSAQGNSAASSCAEPGSSAVPGCVPFGSSPA